MDASIAQLLMLDGAVNGAIYALLAVSFVLVFAVTRVIFVPQGEYGAFGALTMAQHRLGQGPGATWLLLALTGAAAASGAAGDLRAGRSVGSALGRAAAAAVFPLAACLAMALVAPLSPPRSGSGP